MKPARPAIRYYGAKWKISGWITSHFPNHYCYVEPFGGSAALILSKPKSEFEVYNDLDKGVFNFFKVLRSDKDNLLQLIHATPWSRDELHLSFQNSDCDLENARRFYVRCQQSFGHGSGGWRFQHSDNGYSIVDHWNSTEHLHDVVRRLKEVQFDNSSFSDCFSRYDKPETLFYVDPPYLQSTRSGARYASDMNDFDHARLLNDLKSLKGMAVLSGYDSEMYNGELTGWSKYTKEVTDNSNGRAVECLWISPNCEKKRKSLDELPLFSNAPAAARNGETTQ